MECTQDFEKHDGSFEYVPNPMCSADVFEMWTVHDLSSDGKQCGKCTHVFWAEDPVGKFIISGNLDHSQIRFMLFYITLVDTMHSV